MLEELHATYPVRGFVSTEPAEKWDDGTIVGNGMQGALAFARTSSEEIVLSHEELFLPLFPFPGYLPVREHFDTIRQLVLEGKAAEAQDLVRELKVQGDFPRYNTTNPFVGAASLKMDMAGAANEPASYIRSVDFETGEALTAWKDCRGIFHRQMFVSRADDLVVVRLRSPSGNKINVSLALGEIAREPVTTSGMRDLYPITVEECEGTVADNMLTHRMRFKQRLKDQAVFGCCTAARVILQDGTSVVDGNQLQITNANELLLLIKTVPDKADARVSVADVTTTLAGVKPDYDALLSEHTKLHREMFGRCSLKLGSADTKLISSEELQASSTVGDTDPALVEKAFAAARYGIISSTGNLPPALQGVWTGTWKPRWSGDYTLNGNVQSMVAASLCGNHFECMESLLDYMDCRLDDFRANARELLGFRGFLIPWRASTHGRTHYLAFRNRHHNFPGIYWFAGAAWFAQLYTDYYLYTGNEEFLEKRLKPFLLESAAFYEDYLTLEKDEEFVLCPSSSPENEVTDDVWMAPNATMTIAAIKQLFRTLLMLKAELGVDAAQVKRWKAMLDKMPSYQVGANGALKEWIWPGIENQETHRHASHLYPLYYGMDPEIAASDRLREACRVAIDKRMEHRRHENGSIMAFGFTQLGMPAAYLDDTALAYESVEYLVNRYWSPAMASQHDPHKTLNMDISGGLPALIITMLVQSLMPCQPEDPWVIRLLPCLPDAWPDGRLRGVRCRGGFEVDVFWEKGRLKRVNITSPRAAVCQVEYDGQTTQLQLRKGEQRSLNSALNGM